nr:MgtC/SapB family protein [Tissierella sp.]
MVGNLELVLRLLLATLIGGLIGIERENTNRPAGLRTHILVTVGSALIMLISTQNFGEGNDPARLAAQVVSGIGFLGAGTIIRTGNTIRGLTTAASLWVCGGIGLAIGSGYYLGGITTAIIVFLSLGLLNNLETKLEINKYRVMILKCVERPGLIGNLGKIFGENDLVIKDIKITRDEEEEDSNIIKIKVTLLSNRDFSHNQFKKIIDEVEGVISVEWQS